MTTSGPSASVAKLDKIADSIEASMGNSTSSATGGNIKVGLPKYVTSGKTTAGNSGLIKWIIVAAAVVTIAWFNKGGK